MNGTAPAATTFYRPAEVAAMLRCSQWWVKEQARRRRIPFCWIGGGYRFTAEHVTEIARLCEVRPSVPAAPPTDSKRPVPRPRVDTESEPTVRLRARVPRRVRNSTVDSNVA
jgi:hypothetical protein